MWQPLQFNDLKTVLAKEEIERLVSLQDEDKAIIEQTLDLVSDTFRGAIKSKGMKISTVEHSIPSSYKLPALILARRQVWTRFPNSQSIALDDIRQKEIEWAEKLLKDVPFDVDTIPWEDDPENPNNPEYKEQDLQGSIKVPYMRFTQFPYGNEFNEMINTK
jgi:hypothetical protein